MRRPITLWLSFIILSAQAQRPNIATLLSLVDCVDTTCVSQNLRPMNYCLQAGEEEDGWLWFTCGPFDQLAELEGMIILGYTGNAGSNYRKYVILTGDTVFADTLTAELYRLGFTKEQTILRDGHLYGNAAYPSLEVHRSEKRHFNFAFKTAEEPHDPHALPMDSLSCERFEWYHRKAMEKGYDRAEIIPKLLWGFAVVVPTPQLSMYPGKNDGNFVFYYPVTDPKAEFVIKDLFGKEVYRSTTQGARTDLNLSALPHGVYCLTVPSKFGMLSKAFMKN